MLTRRPLHSILKRPVGYDAGLVARPKHFSHHELREFGVSLHRNKSSGDIHCLSWAILGMGQRYDGGRILDNHIAVCLVNFLRAIVILGSVHVVCYLSTRSLGIRHISSLKFVCNQ